MPVSRVRTALDAVSAQAVGVVCPTSVPPFVGHASLAIRSPTPASAPRTSTSPSHVSDWPWARRHS